jgi:hypothetical protein
MAADLACTGTSIDIRASNVTIYSFAHGIEGWRTSLPCISAGVGVPGGVSHVRLIGVDVRDCQIGILFENVSASMIQTATVWWNLQAGMRITGSPELSRADTIANTSVFDNEIQINSGTQMVIRNNRIEADAAYNMGGCRIGIYLGDVTGSVVGENTLLGWCQGMQVGGSENKISGNNLSGGSEGLVVAGRRNVASQNAVRGFTLVGIADYGSSNTFRTNTVENGGFGVDATGAHGVFDGNTVQNNGNQGFNVEGSFILVTRNTIVSNMDVGLFARLGGEHNIMVGNTVLNNSGWDLQDDHVECGSNIWRENRFGTASLACIH